MKTTFMYTHTYIVRVPYLQQHGVTGNGVVSWEFNKKKKKENRRYICTRF